MKKMKQPNNNAIALLIALNLIVSIIVLMNTSNSNEDKNKAYANAYEVGDIEISSKETEKEEEDVIYEVESVTKADENVPTIPLYFSHANDEGAFFTYLRTETPQSWEQGYWYIDYGTLNQANINPILLKHNDEIQGVFYPSEEGDHFEIKEVVAKSESYSY